MWTNPRKLPRMNAMGLTVMGKVQRRVEVIERRLNDLEGRIDHVALLLMGILVMLILLVVGVWRMIGEVNGMEFVRKQ